ncbi:MAG: phosphatidate cytidylyltransferase [Bdellovibrionales bacterium]
MLSLNENLKKRLLTILIGAPIVIGVIYMGGIIFKIALGLAMFIALYEWFSMAKKAKRATILNLLGVLYIVAGFASLYFIQKEGFEWILLLLLCIWSSDSLAYVFGKSIGGPKMSPTISPNKTWSGYVGALVATWILLILVSLVMGSDIEASFLPVYLLFSVIIGVVGQSGDLMVSALKRHVGVKDTGALFPGHGGILDRIDALLLVAPVYLSIYLMIDSAISSKFI